MNIKYCHWLDDRLFVVQLQIVGVGKRGKLERKEDGRRENEYDKNVGRKCYHFHLSEKN